MFFGTKTIIWIFLEMIIDIIMIINLEAINNFFLEMFLRN